MSVTLLSCLEQSASPSHSHPRGMHFLDFLHMNWFAWHTASTKNIIKSCIGTVNVKYVKQRNRIIFRGKYYTLIIKFFNFLKKRRVPKHVGGSSEPSSQSGVPSHFQWIGMHLADGSHNIIPSSHWWAGVATTK